MVNFGLKMHTCELPKRTEQCIGILKMQNDEHKKINSSFIDGERFVASNTQVPINNYNKINIEQLKTLPYFQNYHKGIPSKVSKTLSYIIINIILI